jgi:hypothetical protein
MAEGEGAALDKLRGLSAWLGMTDDELRAHEPHPGAQAYPAFVAWLALNGSRADVVLAFLANLVAWGENCGEVTVALREAYGAGNDAVAFFDFFASPPEDFQPRALEVLNEGLAAGDAAGETWGPSTTRSRGGSTTARSTLGAIYAVQGSGAPGNRRRDASRARRRSRAMRPRLPSRRRGARRRTPRRRPIRE